MFKRDGYPFPKISEVLDSFGNSAYVSTIDIASVNGKFPWTKLKGKILPVGLVSATTLPRAPLIFHFMMDLALNGLTWMNCLVYLDDVIVF